MLWTKKQKLAELWPQPSVLSRSLFSISSSRRCSEKCQPRAHAEKNLFASQNISGKTLDRLSASIPVRFLAFFLEVDQGLVSWIAREVGELCTESDALAGTGTTKANSPTIMPPRPKLRPPAFSHLLSSFPSRRALHTVPSFQIYSICCNHKRKTFHRAVDFYFLRRSCKKGFRHHPLQQFRASRNRLAVNLGHTKRPEAYC